jgi:hypothetical protein
VADTVTDYVQTKQQDKLTQQQALQSQAASFLPMGSS